MQRPLIVMVILATLLAGCLPSQNQGNVDIQPLVNTAVAQTVEAQNQMQQMVAETVAAQAPAATATLEALPTNTELPAPTLEVLTIPTDTPLPVILPVDTPSDVASPTPAPLIYACDVFTQAPDYLEDIKAGSKFEIKWMIVNTGTRAWDAGVDVKYSDGWKMTGESTVEIPVKLAPGNSFTISLTATAPSKKGHQYMTWVVEGQLCYPSVIINVK